MSKYQIQHAHRKIKEKKTFCKKTEECEYINKKNIRKYDGCSKHGSDLSNKQD